MRRPAPRTRARLPTPGALSAAALFTLSCDPSSPPQEEPHPPAADAPAEPTPTRPTPEWSPLEVSPAALEAADVPCPPGMIYVPPGEYVVGMKEPLPYGIVDTTKMEVVDAPEQRCPEAIASTPGATACWVQTDLHDLVITQRPISTPGFCMEALPFPGDGPYPADGMTTWDAARFEEMLGGHPPRRMCTYSEYQLAVAGPTASTRFVYGDAPDPTRCQEDEAEPIGSRSTCRNPETGAGEYGAVISQWVRLDEQLVDWACSDVASEGPHAGIDRCRASGNGRLDERREDGSFAIRFIVAGGTRRLMTRQAPFTPHTFHDHGQVSDSHGCDSWGWDDGPAVCADPDPAYTRCGPDSDAPECDALRDREGAWSALLGYCQGRRMTECMNQGLGDLAGEAVDVCPESTGELGSGQGR